MFLFRYNQSDKVRVLPKRKEHVLRRKNIDNLSGS